MIVTRYISTFIKFVLLIFCSITSYDSRAEKVFDFDHTCQRAYADIMALKINSGQELIKQAKIKNPDNLIPELLQSYVDFFVLFFNETTSEYQLRKANFDERIRILSEGPENSPFNKYCQSIVTLQKAVVAIKFGERWSAGWAFKKAFSLIKENKKAFPAFIPNDLVYGPLEVAAGTIPDSYKWLAGVFGIRGNIQNGMQRMRNLLSSNDPLAKIFSIEGHFYYCYLLFYVENKPDEAVSYIVQKKLDVVNNHLYTYVAANLSINNKQNEYGKNIILHRNTSSQYMSIPAWEFELGYAQMRHLQLSDAAFYFESFLKKFKGKTYVKDVWQKLSWCYYLQGDMIAAVKARQMILQNGATNADADKQALKDAESGIWPNSLLLKARLLNDGGYHKEALSLLAGKTINDFSKTEDKLEFTYRVARIYDDVGQDTDAVRIYLIAIKQGEGRTEYYAARAALQVGYIYEKQGNTAMAITYYQKCLSMKNHEYKNSLDQRAKAGISRCKGE